MASDGESDQSLYSVGEAIHDIAETQLPLDLIGEAHRQINIARDIVREQVAPGPNALRLLLPLGDASLNLVDALDKLQTARGKLAEYLQAIGWVGSRERLEQMNSLAQYNRNFCLPAGFRERSGSGDMFYATGEDGTIYFRDPVTRKIIPPGAIPEGFLSDPELASGFSFWQGYGPQISFSLLLCPHASGNDLRSSSVDLRSEAQRLGRDGQPLFVEYVGTIKSAEELRRLYNQTSGFQETSDQPQPSENVPARGSNGDSYKQETLNQIRSSGVEVIIPDFRVDTTNKVEQSLTTLEFSARPYAESFARRAILTVCGISYRNMYIVGKMGAALAKRHEATGELPSSAGLLVGALHKNIAETLRSLGVNVNVSGDIDPRTEFFARGVSEGRIAAGELRKLATKNRR